MKNTIPLHYQRHAVDHILTGYEKGYRGCICGDKMGLGKTIVALMIAEEIEKKFKLIAVVCPAHLKPKWRREILEKCDDDRDYRFAVYAYTDLTDAHTLAQAKTARYDLIIFDEVHYGKGYQSQRTIATLGDEGIHTVGVKLLGLSGTWPPKDIGDTFTWFNASQSPLAPRGYKQFCYTFAADVKDGYGPNGRGLVVKGFVPNDLWYEHFPPTFIGREMDDPEIKTDVPKGISIDVVVDVPKAIENAEIKLFGQVLEDPDLMQKAIEASPSFDAITEFRKMQGLAKVHAVVEYALDAWENNEKKLFIIAFHHEVADKIYTTLLKKKLPVVLITGQNTSAEERDDLVQVECKKDESVIVATLDAIREGIDVLGFSMTLFAEIDWRAWAMDQGKGRTRRIGQTKVVRWVFFFFARGVDKMMRRTIKEKEKLERDVRNSSKTRETA